MIAVQKQPFYAFFKLKIKNNGPFQEQCAVRAIVFYERMDDAECRLKIVTKFKIVLFWRVLTLTA